MSKADHAAITLNAAGIADALACLQSEDAKALVRLERTTEELGGHVGVMQQVARAAEFMERFRVGQGESAKWGGDLPYLYDVWDAIAQRIWSRLGEEPLDQLVACAIWSAMNAEATS